ncbi:MAG: DUF4423 domain-containing protein [Proteobacteria bacterium]|nr:DUF4423 domain-containing protein [Pseudomonadota bacterium]
MKHKAEALKSDEEGAKVLKFILAKYSDQFPRPLTLRSTAKHLGLSVAYLSQLVSGKRRLTHMAANRISQSIKLSDAERDVLMMLAQDTLLGSRENSSAVNDLLKKSGVNFVNQDPEALKVISEWYHIAILEMTFLEIVLSPSVVSKKLSIPLKVAKDAMSRLEKLNLLIKTSKGRYLKNEANTIFAMSNTNAAYSLFTKQMIELALESVDGQDVAHRLINTYTLPIHVDQLPEAKKIVREFARKMLGLCKTDTSDTSLPTPSDVYQLNVQFFSLTTTEGKKEK